MTVAALLACYCACILVVSLAGGLLPLVRGLTHTRVQVYLSFAAGTMLGAAFFHMLPDAAELVGNGRFLFAWVAGGLLGLFFLERFFAFHHHEVAEAEGPAQGTATTETHRHADAEAAGQRGAGVHEPGERLRSGHERAETPTAAATQGRSGPVAGASPLHAESSGFEPHQQGLRGKSSALAWGAAAVGLSIHTLVGGVALASAVAAAARESAVGPWGLGVFLATLLHKPADALTIVTLMVSGGANRRRAVLANSLFALVIPLGVAIFYVSREVLAGGLESQFTGCALAFSAGTFLCIALGDLLPELQFHEHDRVKLSLALLAGLALMFLTARLEP